MEPTPQEIVIRSLDGFSAAFENIGFVRNLTSGASKLVPPSVAEVLSNIQSLQPVDAHLKDTWGKWSRSKKLSCMKELAECHLELYGGITFNKNGFYPIFRNILIKLKETGLLVTRNDFVEQLKSKLPSKASSSPQIGSFCISTCNRPQTAERALQSYLANFQKFNRHPRVIVSDDSSTEENRELTKRLVLAVGDKFGVQISYIGPKDRERMIFDIANANPEREKALRFCLLGRDGIGERYGVNRNVLLLATRGELVMNVDDDSLCNLYRSKDHKDELAFSTITDSVPAQTISTYATREKAKGALEPVSMDLLASHEALLGKPRTQALVEYLSGSTSTTFRGLNEISIEELAFERGKIFTTLSGLVGDSGCTIDIRKLLDSDPEWEKKFPNKKLIETSYMSREIIKLSNQYRVFINGPFMTTFHGLDNRDLLPPFFPHFRMEDHMFKETVKWLRPDATLAYIPLALEHSPLEARSDGEANISENLCFSIYEMLAVILKHATINKEPYNDWVIGRRELANEILAFVEMPFQVYKRRLTEELLIQKLTELSAHKKVLKSRRKKIPRHLVEQLESTLKKTEQQLCSPFCLADYHLLTNHYTAQEAEELTRKLIIDYAHAIAHF